MKLAEAIEQVRVEQPHSFSDDHCTLFVSEVEALVQEFLQIPLADRVKYKWEEDGAKELIVSPPYDRLYISWLKAKICYNNGELEAYANNQDQFVTDFQDFKAWAIRTGKVTNRLIRFKNWW